MIVQLDTENADRDLTSQVTVLTDTPDASNPLLCQAIVFAGDGTKDLDGTGGDFELEITVDGNSVQPGPQIITLGASDTRACFVSNVFPCPANKEVVVKLKSPNGADTDVDTTAYLYDVSVTPANFEDLGIESDGDLTKVNALHGHTAQTGDSYAVVNHGTYGNSALRSRGDSAWTTATGFSTHAASDVTGGTTVAAAVTHGDSNWATATGFSTHDAAAVKTAIEAAGSSIAQILADTDEMQGDLADGGRLDTLLDTVLSRLTAARAGYLDKLNVSGTLAHSDAASTYKASGFSTHDAAAVWSGMTDAGANKIADHVHRRSEANIRASADGDSLGGTSLYGLICRNMVYFKYNAATSKFEVKDGAGSVVDSYTATSDEDATPIVGMEVV